ncbi:MAG TPA: TonB-dependent receptor [Noviherbaspirillum sp.]|uniref:TonB-dependent receptor domain-containing protein n=1 Tax=Noviherbaspirillum sp. TaxID=1926288 RepID=UPI002D6188D2|nr:TonB-dependent receptor [Noviherbaspirillum sp.]HYD95194.1 TonB-dependent receptor [Noviherbaspirillum sp.]
MTSPVSRRVQAAGKPLALAVAVSAAFSAAPSVFAEEKKLDTLVVTATRTPQIAREVLADNVVIGADELARSGGTSLADVLQRQRGIEITRNGGPGTQSGVFIRGTDNKQNIVLVDGVRVGSATSGGASWNAIPLSQIDRVEIVYGPLSTMYGADAVGGVIQIFTKQGDGTPAPSVSAGIGTYATRTVEAGVSGSSEQFRYAIRAAHERSEGFSATKPTASRFTYNPDKDGYNQTSASGQFSYRFAKGHEAGVTFLHNLLKSQFDSGPAMDDRTRYTVGTYSAFLKNQLMPDWASQVQVSRAADHSTSDASFGRTVYDTNQDTVSWQNNFTVRKTDVFQVIAEHRREEVDSTEAAVARSRTTNSIGAAYQLREGAHLAAVSVRNDDNSQFGSRTTGNASYGYRISNALRASASIGTSFRAPTFNELYFPQFGIASNRPEKGRNAEIGLYYDDGKSQYSAVYYRNRLTDLLVNTSVCPVEQATHAFGCAYNVNKALLTGLSLGASTTAGNFTLRGTLDLQDPKDETTGRQLQRRARKHGTVALDYSAGAATTGAELVFSGYRYDDTNNRFRLGGYGVLNLYANYEFAKNWTAFGRWNNVFDKEYELARTYNTAGSNLFVGVRYAMK